MKVFCLRAQIVLVEYKARGFKFSCISVPLHYYFAIAEHVFGHKLLNG